jgi:hypothetical protein
MSRACLLAVLLTGLMGTGPRLFAHGNESLFARVSPGDGGAVTIELTADLGGNALIVDEADARRILSEALLVQLDGQQYPLAHFGTLTFEQRTHYSDDAPIASRGDPTPHQLLTAVWHARLPGRSVSFATPMHTAFDVVLWNTAEDVPSGQSRWMLLICGEESRIVRLSSGPQSVLIWLSGCAVAIVVMAGGLLASWRRHQRGRRTSDAALPQPSPTPL